MGHQYGHRDAGENDQYKSIIYLFTDRDSLELTTYFHYYILFQSAQVFFTLRYGPIIKADRANNKKTTPPTRVTVFTDIFCAINLPPITANPVHKA